MPILFKNDWVTSKFENKTVILNLSFLFSIWKIYCVLSNFFTYEMGTMNWVVSKIQLIKKEKLKNTNKKESTKNDLLYLQEIIKKASKKINQVPIFNLLWY